MLASDLWLREMTFRIRNSKSNNMVYALTYVSHFIGDYPPKESHVSVVRFAYFVVNSMIC